MMHIEEITLRSSLFSLIKNDYHDFAEDSYICNNELNKYRNKQLTRLISEENRELNSLEKEVVEAISSSKILSENIEDDLEEKTNLRAKELLTILQHLAEAGLSLFHFLVFYLPGSP
ncbi:MAG: hypothetical protein WKG06_15480 [Segetibacter sp.]